MAGPAVDESAPRLPVMATRRLFGKWQPESGDPTTPKRPSGSVRRNRRIASTAAQAAPPSGQVMVPRSAAANNTPNADANARVSASSH
ncbi:hypothetical protein ACEVHA_028070 [Klebsiella pneumoniae]